MSQLRLFNIIEWIDGSAYLDEIFIDKLPPENWIPSEFPPIINLYLKKTIPEDLNLGTEGGLKWWVLVSVGSTLDPKKHAAIYR